MRFQLTEIDYRSNEDVEMIPVVVSKNVRLANTVTFLLSAFSESEAISTGQPLPAIVPLDNNPLSPNRATCRTDYILCTALDCRPLASRFVAKAIAIDRINKVLSL